MKSVRALALAIGLTVVGGATAALAEWDPGPVHGRNAPYRGPGGQYYGPRGEFYGNQYYYNRPRTYRPRAYYNPYGTYYAPRSYYAPRPYYPNQRTNRGRRVYDPATGGTIRVR